MLSGGFVEEKSKEINLQHINSDAFRQVLSYIYTGKLTISSETVLPIYEAADYLSYDYVRFCCTEFMKEDVSAATCVQYLLIAEKL